MGNSVKQLFLIIYSPKIQTHVTSQIKLLTKLAKMMMPGEDYFDTGLMYTLGLVGYCDFTA